VGKSIGLFFPNNRRNDCLCSIKQLQQAAAVASQALGEPGLPHTKHQEEWSDCFLEDPWFGTGLIGESFNGQPLGPLWQEEVTEKFPRYMTWKYSQLTRELGLDKHLMGYFYPQNLPEEITAICAPHSIFVCHIPAVIDDEAELMAGLKGWTPSVSRQSIVCESGLWH